MGSKGIPYCPRSAYLNHIGRDLSIMQKVLLKM